MKITSILVMSLFASITAYGDETKTSVDRAREMAIRYFESVQVPEHNPGESNSITHTRDEVLKALSQLNPAGRMQQSETSAACISGGCGFAGCDYLFLVTTPFTERSVNAQTQALAGLIFVSTTRKIVRLEKLVHPEAIQF
jgi:hypothetical protein